MKVSGSSALPSWRLPAPGLQAKQDGAKGGQEAGVKEGSARTGGRVEVELQRALRSSAG